MKSVGVRELKAHLSSVLARVQRGEAIAVTDRRRRVAVLVPAADTDPALLLERLAGVARIGWSGGKPKGLRAPPEVRGSSVSDAVVEDRR